MVVNLLLIFSSLLLSGCASFYVSNQSQDFEKPKVSGILLVQIDGQYPDGKSYTHNELDNESKKYIMNSLKKSLDVSDVCFSDKCDASIKIVLTERSRNEFPESNDTKKLWSQISFLTFTIVPVWTKVRYDIECKVDKGSEEKVRTSYGLYGAMNVLLAPIGAYWAFNSELNGENASSHNRMLVESIEQCISSLHKVIKK